MRFLIKISALACLLFLQIEAIENEEAVRQCHDASIPCDSGQCIRREEWCDDRKNCGDGSDEAYCRKRYLFNPDPNGCRHEDTHFLCDDGRCVPLLAKCDGHSDCTDESDEKDCEPDEYENYDEDTTTEETKDIPTKATTTETYSVSTGFEDQELPTTKTQAPKLAVTQDAPLSSSTLVNFYAKRMEQENGRIDLQSRASVTSHPLPTIPEPVPRRHHNQDMRQTSTTPRPLPSTTSSTRDFERTRYHVNVTAQPSGSYDSYNGNSPRSYVAGQYPNQQHIQSTRPYDSRRDQYQTQPPRTYDPRRDRHPYQTQSTRSYDSRRDHPQYSTQTTRSYDSRRDHPQYPTQTTRSRRDPPQYQTPPTGSYDSRRYPHQYQTQPSRSYDSRRDHQTQSSRPEVFRGPFEASTRQPHYPSHPQSLTIRIPSSKDQASESIQRIHLDSNSYFDGYYAENGQFVVVSTNLRHPDYRSPSTDVPKRNGPHSATPPTVPFERQLKAPPRFYFAKNYTRIYGSGNIPYLRKGREWILSIQNSTGGWGKETPRALVALSLINNSFVNGTYENDVMQKYFQVYLGTSLLRGEAKTTSLSRLAMSVNALLATCQNPRDFHGTDLTDLIQNRLSQGNRDDRTRINPFVYLSLCLADTDLTRTQEHDLMTRLNDHYMPDEYARDMLSLSITAFSCHLRRQESRDSEHWRSMFSRLSNATAKLLKRMKPDGSFGSVYSTALAAQALLSLNDTQHWNPESTLDFLKSHQKSNGSFGDFLATYLVLPVLSGRSLLHLRNTECTPPKSDRVLSPSEILEYSGPKQQVRYSIHIGRPRVRAYSVDLLVPRGLSFFDCMRVAQHQNDLFKFSYEERNGRIHVYSISNIPNDSERGLKWKLYAKRNSDQELNELNSQELVLEDIREFYPRSDQHLIFWYHPDGILA